jgi:thiol:disulfide interchange protein DsbC
MFLMRVFMKVFKQAIAVGVLVASGQLWAAESPSQVKGPEAVIKRELESSRSDIKVQSVTASPIGGIYAVQIVNGPLVYASADGKHFILGDLFAVQGAGRGFVNLAEQARNGERAILLAGVKLQDMVVFSPKGKPKAVISVYTDVDCGYCRKLHKEVPQLNSMGIEVRYMAYPRAGIGSDSYQKLVTIWCSKDRQSAMTRFKNGENVTINSCKDNPVSAHYALGDKMGVNGTPALIKADGELIPGYMPAAELAKMLGVQ